MALTVVPDDFSPIYQGDQLEPLSIQVATYVNGLLQAFDLTGLTISMKMSNEQGTTINCTGTWTIDNATGGQAHYNYTSTDVATPGLWTMYIKFTNGTSGAFVHGATKQIEILAAP